MKKIKTKHAIGHTICHDITRIIKGVVKDTPFRKGHIIQEEDVALLLQLGKEHMYVYEQDERMLHENDAAKILYELCANEGMEASEIREGKIEVRAQKKGLLQVNVDRLDAINEVEDIMIATISHNSGVHIGDIVAGTRVIPLMIEKEKLEEVKKIAGSVPILSIQPYKLRRAGVITTGSEVYHGRIKDTFTPVIENKLQAFDIDVVMHTTVDDNLKMIEKAIQEMRNARVDMIVCTGGMSVDPDDVTPLAIRQSGAHIVSYGAPVLPGAMFLIGYFNDGTPIVGLPGCVMYAKATVFDLCLPRIAAGIPFTKKDLAKMGNGGFCTQCPICHFPNCGFGRGIV